MKSVKRKVVTMGAASCLAWSIVVVGAEVPEFEEPPILRAADVVSPADLLTGPHHRVDDRVVNDGFMNHFVIRSDFGDFEAGSERMLGTRVREVYAIAKLRELSRTDAFAGALKRAALAPVNAVEQVVDQPVETLKGIPGGVTRKVRGLYYSGRKTAHEVNDGVKEHRSEDEATDGEAGDAAKKDDDESDQYEDEAKGAAKSFVGWTSAYRSLAKSLEVDPYTTNPVLRKELERLAQAAFVAGLGFKMVVPVPQAIGIIGDVKQTVWDTPPEELERVNNLYLKDNLGISKEMRLDFFASDALTTTTQTILVEELEKMESVSGREQVIELAIAAEEELDGWFLTEAVLMLGTYHTRKAPLQQLVVIGNEELGEAVIGVTAENVAILPVPYDHVTWQPGMDRESPLQAYAGREVWLTGSISSRAKTELEARGFVVHPEARARFEAAAAAP
jgi:hypothetical protein